MPLFLSTPPLLSLKRRAKSTQTVGHVILALVRAKQSWESGATVTCMARTKKVAKRHISPFLLLPKSVPNTRRHPLLPCLIQICLSWTSDIKQTEENSQMNIFRMGLVSQSPSDQRVPSAGFGRPGWAGVWKWSLKLLPVWPWERVGRPTAGAAEHMQREGEGEQETKRSERGTAHSHPHLPPSALWPPALPSSTLQTPSPWPPRMQIPGLRPKYQKPKSVQIAGGTIHRFTHLPPSPRLPKCPLLLVPQHTWFHLN